MIRLTSAESASYYFIKLIRNKIKVEPNDRQEVRFLEIFSDFSIEDWHDIYIDLANSIQAYINEHESLIQETIPKSWNSSNQAHNILNKMLLIIVKKKKPKTRKIPDIYLGTSCSKPSIIIINKEETLVNILTVSTLSQSQIVSEEYIITGNKDELELYYTFIATLYILNRDYQESFDKNQVLILFPNEYAKYVSEAKQNNIEEQFERAVSLAEEEGLLPTYCKVEPYLEKKVSRINDYIYLASQIANNIGKRINAIKKTRTN